VNFSANKLHAMWEEASLLSRASHPDVLLAHTRGLIMHAQKTKLDEKQ
jgi:hypothetical protein